MKFLKPDKHKINVLVVLLATVYFSSLFSNYLLLRRNLAIEVYMFQLGGEIESNGKELNRLYSAVQADTRALPQDDQNVIRNIMLKYDSFKWGIITIFLYLLSCLILYRIDNDKYGREYT